MSRDAEELASWRQAFTTPSSSDRPRPDCPPAERIWEGVRGELKPAEFGELIQHLAKCPVCTEAWQLTETIEREAAAADRPRHSPPSRPAWLQPLAVAAAVSFVLFVGFDELDMRSLFQGSSRESSVRGDDSELLKLLSKDPLPREDCHLQWQGPENAHYNLLVKSADQPALPSLVVESELEAPEFRIPEGHLADLPSGARLMVHLEAYDPTGGFLENNTFHFRIR